MRYCKHTQWLGFAIQDGEVYLQGTDRLHTLVEDLPDPDSQSPSLFVFIGNRAKSLAVKELAKSFSPPPRDGLDPGCMHDESTPNVRPDLSGRRAHGEIHLHVHTSSTFTSRPVLLAEGDIPIHERQRRPLVSEKCHELTSRLLHHGNGTSSLADHADKLYFRLLAPFSDVFCFFAADLGGLRPIVERLAVWLDLGRPSNLSKATRPSILIVTEQGQAEEATLSEFKQMLTEETTIDASEQFSDVQVLGLLPRGKISSKGRHRTLKEALLNASDRVRAARSTSRSLFSARDFSAFFDYASDHLAATSSEPFDFILTSRVDNKVSPYLERHLVDFLQRMRSFDQLRHFAIPVIASSILLDSYTPNLHSK